MIRLIIEYGHFCWDPEKGAENIKKHGVGFVDATHAFLDPKRILAVDEKHSFREERFYCIGRVGVKVMTVRFTYRKSKIRIFGAGYWRQGRRFYEKENL